jgi:hypothetical protein
MTLSTNDTQHNNTAIILSVILSMSGVLFIVMLNVILANAVWSNVALLSAVMLWPVGCSKFQFQRKQEA